jgi:ABC-type dipeptide/oligopeptide/nickel transport system permease subunit
MVDEIQESPAPSGETSSKDEERVSVASNWKLVWWRFRKNRLAVASMIILLAFYAVVLVPDFFSNQDPEATDAALAFIPVQRIGFFDHTGFNPSVPEVIGKRNPVTLKMEWVRDEAARIPIALFVRGYTYKVLGLFETNIHLVDAKDPKSKGRPHFLGTDRLGRDQWSRMMFGTRTSMTVGLVAVALGTILGVFLGGVSGYFGGWIDMLIQRVIEILQSLPTIPIWLMMTAALPQDWPPERVFLAITIILAFIGWTTLALPVTARGGLHPGGGAGRVQPPAHHPAAHGSRVHQPYHRREHPGHPGHDHQRDLAQLPGAGHPAAGHQLGGALAGGPKHPDGGAGAVADVPRAGGDPGGAGIQSRRRRLTRCRRPIRTLGQTLDHRRRAIGTPSMAAVIVHGPWSMVGREL